MRGCVRGAWGFVREEPLLSAIITLGAALTLLLIAAIPANMEMHRRWVSSCEARGGRVISHADTQSVVVVGTNGQPAMGTSSSTIYYCLSADGRILDLK